MFSERFGCDGRQCSSLDGPRCLRIKEQYLELSDEELAGIEETQDEMMQALEEELEMALQQVGAAGNADIPALLETIMGAMSNVDMGAMGAGGNMAQISIGTAAGLNAAAGAGKKDGSDGMVEVNLFGTKILLPKDAAHGGVFPTGPATPPPQRKPAAAGAAGGAATPGAGTGVKPPPGGVGSATLALNPEEDEEDEEEEEGPFPGEDEDDEDDLEIDDDDL